MSGVIGEDKIRNQYVQCSIAVDKKKRKLEIVQLCGTVETEDEILGNTIYVEYFEVMNRGLRQKII